MVDRHDTRRDASIAVIILLSLTGLASGNASASLAPLTTHSFDYVVVILMENHNLNQIIGNSSAPYMNQLANTYGLATQYTGVVHPSLPNYLALFGGTTFGCTSDVNPNSNACTATAWNSPNLADRIEAAGFTWKAYMENMPSNCYLKNAGSGTATYSVRHDPFVYFSDIVNNTARCNRVVSANISPSGLDDRLINDLGSTFTASNFMWLTPNMCNNMHNCPISTGDSYLSQLVPQILNSTIFQTQNAALFITFDEGKTSYPSDFVYTVWAGPAAKNNFQSSTFHTHYSLLKTLETVWGLSPLTSNDASASDMMEFFNGPPSTTTTTPTTNSTISTSNSTLSTTNSTISTSNSTISTSSSTSTSSVVSSTTSSTSTGTGQVVWSANFESGDNSQFNGGRFDTCTNGVIGVSSTIIHGGHYSGLYSGQKSGTTSCREYITQSFPDLTDFYWEMLVYVPSQTQQAWVSFATFNHLPGSQPFTLDATRSGTLQLDIVSSNTIVPENVGSGNVQFPYNVWFKLSVSAHAVNTPQGDVVVSLNGTPIIHYAGQLLFGTFNSGHFGLYMSKDQQSWTVYNDDIVVQSLSSSGTTTTTQITSSSSTVSSSSSTTSVVSTTTTTTSTSSSSSTATTSAATIGLDKHCSGSATGASSTCSLASHAANVLVLIGVEEVGGIAVSSVTVGSTAATSCMTASQPTPPAVNVELWAAFVTASGTDVVTVNFNTGGKGAITAASFTGTANNSPACNDLENTVTNTGNGKSAQQTSVTITPSHSTDWVVQISGSGSMQATSGTNSYSISIGSNQMNIDQNTGLTSATTRRAAAVDLNCYSSGGACATTGSQQTMSATYAIVNSDPISTATIITAIIAHG